jgi:hypothetical protein
MVETHIVGGISASLGKTDEIIVLAKKRNFKQVLNQQLSANANGHNTEPRMAKKSIEYANNFSIQNIFKQVIKEHQKIESIAKSSIINNNLNNGNMLGHQYLLNKLLNRQLMFSKGMEKLVGALKSLIHMNV